MDSISRTESNVYVSKNIVRKSGGGSTWRIIVSNKYLYIMFIPVAVYYLLFCYTPLYGVLFAFKEYYGGNLIDFLLKGKWIGLEHFRLLFSEPLFYRSLKNVFILNAYFLVFEFSLTIILALLLNELKNIYFKRVIQTVIYIPHFFSWVLIAGIVVQLLSPDHGIVVAILKLFNGGEAVNLLSDPKYFRTILVVTDIFKEIGFGTVIYLASIAGISSEMYDSAEIDGANRFQKMKYITLPAISDTIVILLLLQISCMVSGHFDQLLMLYNPTVYSTGDVLDTYVYRTGLQEGNWSFAATVGLFKSVVMATMLVVANFMSRRMFKKSLF